MRAAATNDRVADADIERSQAVSLADIAIEHRIILKRSGGEFVGPCPLCGGTDRFAINSKKQVFNCRGCGGKGRGAIAFIQWLDGVGFRDAVEILIGQQKPRSNTYAKAENSTYHDQRRQHEKANWFWSQRQPISGSITENYLRSARGITCPLPPTLAFLPPRKPDQHPAMIAAFGLYEENEPGVIIAPRDVTAVHLTLLRPDGTGKADTKPNKLMIGSPSGKPIVIAPPNDLLGLAICEGIEDTLSVHQATGLGAWAAGAAGFMPRLADVVPHYIECVTIYAHADKAGQDGASKLAAKFRERNIEVIIEGVAA